VLGLHKTTTTSEVITSKPSSEKSF